MVLRCTQRLLYLLGGCVGERQVENALLAVVTGYGMVLYRYGGCANAVVLERP